MRIALFEPEIAGNVGAVLRLGACLGVPVDLIEPLGFLWDDARVRRTAMDYIDHVAITRHADWPAFHASIGAARLVLLTTKGSAQVLHRFMHVLITNSRAFKLAATAAPGPFKTKVAHHRGHQ